MASSQVGKLPLEALKVEKMASEHLCLNLSERVGWDDFPEYAETLLKILGGTTISAAESVELRIWEVSIDGRTISLVFSDYPAMVSLESPSDEGDDVLKDVEAKLQQLRADNNT